ncbi:MAG TPA: flavin reductase family protein [Acidimicrobiales bacterium]|nr:flavin reductase family protein [Acidimicrobiales bacterium]
MAFGSLTGLIDPPLYVVTAAAGGERSGCLVGFATQCSIHPPRFLVCLSVLNHTYGVAGRAEVVGVHLLDADQRQLAAHFGELTGDEADKFAGIRWHLGEFGAPILDDVRAAFEGRVLERLRFGDHVGHLLEPLDDYEVPEAGQVRQLRLGDAGDFEAGHPADEVLEAAGGAPAR